VHLPPAATATAADAGTATVPAAMATIGPVGTDQCLALADITLHSMVGMLMFLFLNLFFFVD